MHRIHNREEDNKKVLKAMRIESLDWSIHRSMMIYCPDSTIGAITPNGFAAISKENPSGCPPNRIGPWLAC